MTNDFINSMLSKGARSVVALIGAVLFVHGSFAAVAEQPRASSSESAGIRHQVTGLFCQERVTDLEQVFERLPQIELRKIDFENAEITVEYDREQVFPGAKTAEEIVQRFDNLLRGASNRTFGIKPLSTIAKEKLTLVEIPIVSLDCKACSLGAYEAIYRLNGVERATASFKQGLLTAMIDPQQTNRAELEKALKQRGVRLRPMN